MRSRRALLCGLISLLVVSSHAGPAVAARGKPYWKNRSNIPVETVTGKWAKARGGRTAVLTFGGENLPAQKTRFVAGWRTPWTKAGTDFRNKGRLDRLVPPSGEVTLTRAVRVQVRGKRWSPWFKSDFRFGGGLGLSGSGRWVGSGALFGPSPKIRYELRLVGKMNGLAQIDGRVKVSLR